MVGPFLGGLWDGLAEGLQTGSMSLEGWDAVAVSGLACTVTEVYWCTVRSLYRLSGLLDREAGFLLREGGASSKGSQSPPSAAVTAIPEPRSLSSSSLKRAACQRDIAKVRCAFPWFLSVP